MAALGLFTGPEGGGRPPVRPGPSVITCRLNGHPARIIVWPGDTPAEEVPDDARLAGRVWVTLRVD